MIQTNQIGLCIKNMSGEIIGIAREQYKALIFDSVYDTTTEYKTVALYDSEKSAKSSLVGRTKYGVNLSKSVYEKLYKDIEDIKVDTTLEYFRVTYKDIKTFITPCKLAVQYDII